MSPSSGEDARRGDRKGTARTARSALLAGFVGSLLEGNHTGKSHARDLRETSDEDGRGAVVALEVNRLHWTQDVVYGEDRARISRKNGAENVSIVRKIAMNLLRSAPTRDGKPWSGPRKRRRANARFEYLLQVVTAGGTKDALEPRRRARRAE